jgi:Asp-tRNA(Asn)/Glu-tRNA(Gln) amidotransferase A subunit family amidase
MSLTLQSYIDQVIQGSLKPETVVFEYLEKAKSLNPKTNAFLTFADEYVKNNIATLQQ